MSASRPVEWIIGRTDCGQMGSGNVYASRHPRRSSSRLPQLALASSVPMVRCRPPLPNRGRSRAYAAQFPPGLPSFHPKLLLGRWNGTQQQLAEFDQRYAISNWWKSTRRDVSRNDIYLSTTHLYPATIRNRYQPAYRDCQGSWTFAWWIWTVWTKSRSSGCGSALVR